MAFTQTSKYRSFLWLVLFIAFFSGGCSAAKTAPTPLQPKVIQPTLTSPKATKTPTATVTFTPLPSFTPGMTQTPTASATALLPAYYIQHPALVRVASSEHLDAQSWMIQWMDDTHAALRAGYQSKEWAEYLIPQGASQISYVQPITIETVSNLNGSPLNPATLVDSFHIPGKVNRDAWLSPNQQMVLIITLVEQPTATLRLGKRNITPYENLYFEGWIVDLAAQKAQALFYTPEDFDYYWLDKDQYIMATSSCYGGTEYSGQGSFAIDAQALKINGLGDNFEDPCEGGIRPQISPDSLHIIFQNDHGTIETMQGTERVHICPSSGGARSYAWSADGRYVFAACASAYDQPDELRRYDTQTRKVTILTNRSNLPFKAINLVVSPDQTRILFEWGTSNYDNNEPYGVWLLDLQKLDAE